MLKVKLLSDGDYGGMDNVNFPVIVEGFYVGVGIGILGAELINLGAEFIDADEEYYFSLLSGECEVVDEE